MLVQTHITMNTVKFSITSTTPVRRLLLETLLAHLSLDLGHLRRTFHVLIAAICVQRPDQLADRDWPITAATHAPVLRLEAHR
jgi:hypothetical protein